MATRDALLRPERRGARARAAWLPGSLLGPVLVGIVACRGPAEPERAAAPPADDATTRAVRHVAEAAFAHDPLHGVGGAVLVARGDDVLYRAAHGFADAERTSTLTLDDPLPIGSITKSFTAAAILRLVDEETVSLADDVRDHIPDAETRGRTITIAQLLTHTSGLPTLVDVEGFETWARSPRTLDELLDHTRGVPLTFEPGTSFAYSDSGYILLGAVLERLAGATYADVVERELAAPLGMTRTGHALARTGADRAVGRSESTDDPSRLAPAQPIHMSVPHASGALVSTVDDLFLWLRAWRAGTIVSPGLADRAWQPVALSDGTLSGYGFGWKRHRMGDIDVVGHGGWVPGFTAALLHAVEDDVTAIVLTNNDAGKPEASYLARRLVRLVVTGLAELPTIALSAAERFALFGSYRTDAGETWSFLERDDRLVLEADWGSEPLVALAPDELAVAASDGTWVFRFDVPETGGRATSVRDWLTSEPRAVAHRLGP